MNHFKNFIIKINFIRKDNTNIIFLFLLGLFQPLSLKSSNVFWNILIDSIAASNNSWEKMELKHNKNLLGTFEATSQDNYLLATFLLLFND